MTRRSFLAAALAVTSVAGVFPDKVGAAGPAGPPLYPFPTIELQRKIVTNPFGGTLNSRPGDIEGLAYDPVTNSMWLADDSKDAVHEVDFTSGAWRRTLGRTVLEAVPEFVAGGPPGPALAGPVHAADYQAMVFDDRDDADITNDLLYLVGGPGGQGTQHLPAVFRFVRDGTDRFVPETFRSLSNPLQNDFSSAGAAAGKLYFGYGRQLVRYDFGTGTQTLLPAQLATDGRLTGIGFSQDGLQFWATTSNQTLHRFAWNPALEEGTAEPEHDIRLTTLHVIESSAVEIVGAQVVVADGYDSYAINDPDRFALRVYDVGQSAPLAAFTSTPAGGGGAPFTAAFQDTTANRPTELTWDFGDGSPTESVTVPSGITVIHPTPVIDHTFGAPGTYTVALTASNPNGSSTTTDTVTVTAAPSAAFTTTPVTGVAPLTVSVHDQSTPAASITGRVWNFGDGSAPGSGADATHTYPGPGVFTISLEVTNPQGSSLATRTVTVSGPPAPSFTTDHVTGDAPLDVSFADSSTGVPEPTSWTWDFGDGTPGSTERDVLHRYAQPGRYVARLTVSNGVGTTTASTTITVSGSFQGMAPIRLMDTRRATTTVDGLYQGEGRLGPGLSRSVRVVGRGGVPETGVGSVALNVTVVEPTSMSYLTVWPQGKPRPNASNLNYVAGKTIANMVIVPVGAGGNVSLFNEAGDAHLLVDLMGWFPSGPVFTGLTPARLMDTRSSATVDGRFQNTGRVGPKSFKELQVLGRGGIPASADVVGSLVLNVTATEATEASYLTVWPRGFTQPNASNLNWAAGDTVPNMVIVPVPSDGLLAFYNSAGMAHLVVDVLGWFPKGPAFTGLPPARLMDSRADVQTIDGEFRSQGPLGPGETRTLRVAGRKGSGVPGDVVGSIALNVTVVNPTGASYLTVFPTGTARPNASNVNFTEDQTIANMVVARLGTNGEISIFNESASTDVIVDVLGWFAPPV